MDDKIYWLALSTHPRIGSKTFLKLARHFKDFSAIWQANLQDLVDAGLDAKQVEAILEVVKKVDPEKYANRLEKLKINSITLREEKYPSLLKEIPDPPGVLYIRGELQSAEEISLAVVGSRKYSNYGKQVIENLVPSLAQKMTIVSGLALGIDSLAHDETLEAGERTIAVLGCGLDQVYPVSNIRLADQILQNNGAIISEFPLGMPALKQNFPIRNRIIAGMSLGTLVIEAAVDSGSLITANAALTYNREVFAIPGEIFSEFSEGPNHLLKMGAKLVTSADDIFTELNIDSEKSFSEAREIIPDSPEEETLLKLLTKPQIVDDIIRASGLEPALVNSTLVMLEMKGMISNLGGTSYVIRGKIKGK